MNTKGITKEEMITNDQVNVKNKWNFKRCKAVALMIKNLPAVQETKFDPWVGKIPWRRKQLPTPIFLPGEFHGQGRLVSYSTLGHKELDTTEQLTLSLVIVKQFRQYKQCINKILVNVDNFISISRISQLISMQS